MSTQISKKKYANYESIINNLLNPLELDSKDKAYSASIDKSLMNFDASVEWADYIAFLTRLLKTLQSHSKSHWIPRSIEISKCLGKCLAVSLPSGVHRKSLEVYGCIFDILGKALLAQQMNLWIPGILPLMSYASMSVKPSLIELFDKHILELPPNYLKVITKVLLLSLLPGIDDESSESFEVIFALIEKLKIQLNDDSHFWQSMFMVIISNQERRLGALVWCNKKLPDFTDLSKNEEASAIIKQDGGLLIRAFIKGLGDDQILIQRGTFDLMIAKLKLHSPVLTAYNSHEDTQKLIINSCLTVLRKDMSLNRRLWNWLLGSDESLSSMLNTEEQETSNDGDDVSKISSNRRILHRVQYFKDYGESYLVKGFLNLIQSNDIADRIIGYKVSLAFMDKWEIGSLITDKIFIPFLKSVELSLMESERHKEKMEKVSDISIENDVAIKDKFEELFKSASAFFDTIESYNIWSTFHQLINGNIATYELNDNIKLLLFIIRNFNVNEEDMINNHLPLILISLLSLELISKNQKLDRKLLYETIALILSLIPSESFTNSQIETIPPNFLERLIDSDTEVNIKIPEFFEETLNKIKDFYSREKTDEVYSGEQYNGSSISRNEMLKTILLLFNSILYISIQDPSKSSQLYQYSFQYLEVFDKVSLSDGNLSISFFNWETPEFTDIFIRHLEPLIPKNIKNDTPTTQDIIDFYGCGMPLENISQNLDKLSFKADAINVSIVFGLCILFPRFYGSYADKFKKMKLLRITLRLLFGILSSPSSKYNIEVITHILNLEKTTNAEYIESMLVSIFTELYSENNFEGIINFVKIFWTQTCNKSLINSSADAILKKTLYILFDELKKNNVNYVMTRDWLISVLDSEYACRLLNLLISPLLNFNFFVSRKIDLIDDFVKFDYQLEVFKSFFRMDKPKFLSVLNKEVSYLGGNMSITLLQMNKNDDVITYKSILVHVLISFVVLKTAVKDSYGWVIFESNDFNKAILSSLDLLELLLDSTDYNIDLLLNQLVGTSFSNLKASKDSTRVSEHLVSVKFFEIISLIIQKAYHKDYKLLLFNIDEKNPIRSIEDIEQRHGQSELNYIEYLVYSLDFIENVFVFQQWSKLLVDNLLTLSNCIFLVLTPLSNHICSKVDGIFNKTKSELMNESFLFDYKNKALPAHNDQIVGILLLSLQELMNYSHMFLSAVEAKPKNLAMGSSDPGFLSSVMNGVFSVEPSENVNFEESDRYMVLVSFETIVSVCYRIWLWGESHTKISDLKISSEYPGVLKDDLNNSKSIEYIATELKYKSRNLLETLYSMEPSQVLLSLVANNLTLTPSLFKLSHILDNSRPQSTIPHIFNSIRVKMNFDNSIPSEKFKTSLIGSFSERKLGTLLVEYLKSLDIGVIEDIYPESISFLKEANSLPSMYRPLMPYLLRFVSSLCASLSKLKFGEQKKIRKEIGDNYLKCLYYTISSKAVMRTQLEGDDGNIEKVSDEESNDLSRSAEISNVDFAITREDINLSLISIIPELDSCTILKENERTLTIINSIIVNIIQPAIKDRLIFDSQDYLRLMLVISALGCCIGNKAWRLAIHDIFLDSDFFLSTKNNYKWSKIVKIWMEDDKEKIAEFISKVQTSASNTGNLFSSWNEGDLNSKILKIKRITYLLMISKEESLLSHMEDLISKLDELSKSLDNSLDKLKYQVFLCFRAIILRFSEQLLNRYWITIYSRLESVFQNFIIQVMNFEAMNDDTKELTQYIELESLFSASKLLDLILTMGFEEFNLDEWVFVDNSIEKVVSEGVHRNSIVFGLIDKISRLKEYRLPKSNDKRKVDMNVNDETSLALNKPLLCGYKQLNEIALLKPFFDQLGYRAFERIYNLKKPDILACEEDVYHDLFGN